MTKKQTKVITALSIIIFILALMVCQRLWFRIDLTRNKAYTISKVSRNLHAEIPDNITITYCISDKLKNLHPVPGEIEDMLREYAAFSKGKIRVTVRDPVKAGISQDIEAVGIQPRQIQTVEQDQASLTTVYTGLIIEYMEYMEIIPWIISTDTLEYDLTSRIRSMVRETERRIGVMVGDSFRNWREDFGFLEQALNNAGYRIRQIYPGDEIPDSLPAIFVLGGVEDLDARSLYRIDRYIQMGGKALFAVKGVYVDTISGSIEARHQNNLGLLDMIASYGVIVRPELTLDRNALTLQYQTRMPSGAVQFRIVRYPLWIGVMGENGNSEHPVSANFAGVDLFWASPLELHPPTQVEAIPLFTSTAEAWAMRETFNTNPDTSYLFEQEAEATRGIKILGASLNGVFPSFFRGAPKPESENQDEELPDMPPEAGPSRIIVIGDTDFATNIINVSGASYNLDFLLQAADWLGNDDDIIGIRSRQHQGGRLDRIIDPAKRASAMRFSQIVNVAVVPLLVIVAGLFFSRRRPRSKSASSQAVKEHSDGI
ncbi:MAG: GldG family protein [Treponema sp.]|nr:GldG family protein [Treponema sp.]